MDSPEAARMLGVAESEVIDVRQHAGWWEAHHHDMASHEESWRPVAPDGFEAAPEPGSEPEGDQVPDGTVAEVTGWVGDDPDRAARAVDAEEKRDQPRTTLIAALERVIG